MRTLLPSFTPVFSPAFFVRLSRRGLLLPLFVCALVAGWARAASGIVLIEQPYPYPAVTLGWGNNPSPTWCYGPFVLVPLTSAPPRVHRLSMAVITMSFNQGLLISSLDREGKTIGPKPPPPTLLEDNSGSEMNTAGEFAACSIDTDKIALAYTMNDGTIRVAVVQYDPVVGPGHNRYVVYSGPVSVGTGGSISMVPNITSSGVVDGVVLTWAHNTCPSCGPHAPWDIRAQVVSSTCVLGWGGVNAADGAYVWGPLADMPLQPKIVSDEAGGGIITFDSFTDSMTYAPRIARTHHTTHLTSAPAIDFDLDLPGVS